MAASGAVFQHPVNPEAELFPTLIFNLLEGLLEPLPVCDAGSGHTKAGERYPGNN